ncbi:winged helix DNA-binding domain-containing protein [Cohnella lupini]|uniref:Winged helix DNA-binding protein n=1 Tax=Cohnella lupini TaxID=1294267 RepID=A0A3D9IUS5_9BACL|nr:winged helix DNA-binding domain-containing protein [Cohnella lupini]RED65528.1 winged helix DNA-binding protein [Cohnella lupini]
MTESIALRRLIHQGIASRKLETPEQVVKKLGAMQAQDYHQALWAIGTRLPSATVSEIERSIEDRKILLTWPMRGTIHFVLSEDARWMLKLTASRILAQSKRRQEQLGLDERTIERSRRIFHDALQGDKRISRPVLMQLLEDEGIGTANQRGYHLLWYLSQTAFICQGPREGKQQTFVLLDEWVPRGKELPMDEALASLAESYYGGHGPATVHDFAWWAGITLADARRGVEAVKSRLVSEKANGAEYWSSESETAGAAPNVTSVYLLPGFDEYLLGYKDRGAVLREEYAPRITPGNNGIFMPTIVIDGQVVGLWKRTVKKKGIDIELNLFEPLDERKPDILVAAERYCRFMELPLVSITFE